MGKRFLGIVDESTKTSAMGRFFVGSGAKVSDSQLFGSEHLAKEYLKWLEAQALAAIASSQGDVLPVLPKPVEGIQISGKIVVEGSVCTGAVELCGDVASSHTNRVCNANITNSHVRGSDLSGTGTVLVLREAIVDTSSLKAYDGTINLTNVSIRGLQHRGPLKASSQAELEDELQHQGFKLDKNTGLWTAPTSPRRIVSLPSAPPSTPALNARDAQAALAEKLIAQARSSGGKGCLS